jgi:SAM-dependent methyltransferase
MKNGIEALSDLNWLYRSARVLHIANRLDIFTILAEKPLSAEQISLTCRTRPVMTDKLLIACTAMGLLEKEGFKYSNTDLARTYLVQGEKLYQGDIIAHSASVWDFWDRLADEISEESPPRNVKPDEHRNFIMGMHNVAVAGRVQLFLENIDLSGRKKLFDAGAGPGTYSIEACRRYPKLKAVLFDLPETIAIAKQMIAQNSMQDRVSVREASWDTDDFGHDNDVVLLSDVMHGLDSNAEMKLKKAYDSMLPGGLLVVQEFLLNDPKTGPLIAALFNIMVGAYSEKELLSIITQAGFTEPKLVASSEKLGANWVTAGKL